MKNGIVLFDWKTTRTTKKDVKLSCNSLFDDYLSETSSYQQLQQKNLFVRKTAKKQGNNNDKRLKMQPTDSQLFFTSLEK